MSGQGQQQLSVLKWPNSNSQIIRQILRVCDLTARSLQGQSINVSESPGLESQCDSSDILT